MKKYGLLLIGEESNYVLFECDTVEELKKEYNNEIQVWGVNKLHPFKLLRVIPADLYDGLDDRVIGDH